MYKIQLPVQDFFLECKSPAGLPRPWVPRTAEQQGLSYCPTAPPGLSSPSRAQLSTLLARPDAAIGPTAPPLPRAHAPWFLQATGADTKEGKKVVAPEKDSHSHLWLCRLRQNLHEESSPQGTPANTQLRSPTTWLTAADGNVSAQTNWPGIMVNTSGTDPPRAEVQLDLLQVGPPHLTHEEVLLKPRRVDMPHPTSREFSIYIF